MIIFDNDTKICFGSQFPFALSVESGSDTCFILREEVVFGAENSFNNDFVLFSHSFGDIIKVVQQRQQDRKLSRNGDIAYLNYSIVWTNHQTMPVDNMNSRLFTFHGIWED